MKVFLVLSNVLLFFSLSAQKLIFQHGISITISFGNDLKYLLSYNPNISYPIISKKGELSIIPMFDIKCSLYNNNLGSSVLKSFRNYHHLNLALSPTISYSFTRANNSNPGYIPIFSQTFHGYTNTDFDNNIGFSVVYIYQYNFGGGIKKRKLNQRVTNIFVSSKNIYFNYYNDGGPILKWLGDNFDRYWTGGGSIGIKFNHDNNPQFLILSFDKYSGFNQNAFEASGLLYSDNVNYKDMKETTYNSGKYSLIYLNPFIKFGASANWYNAPFDFQDWIHRDISTSPYHFKLKKDYIDFEFISLYEN